MAAGEHKHSIRFMSGISGLSVSRTHFTLSATDDLMGMWRGGFNNFSSCLLTAGAAGERKGTRL
jgi:hypothetical protein